MKKIIAIAITLTIAAMIAGPGTAQAITAAELQAKINALMEQLNDLKAQLAGLGGGDGVGVVCTFTRPLYPEMSGADVQCLQRYLNDAGYTVATTGPGSAGNETEYFGPLTKAAVGAWQDGNGVAYGAWQGYFGPVSQAKYDELRATPPPPAECTIDADCDAGYVCENGVCVEAPECTTDADCDADYECVNEVCRAKEPSDKEGTFTATISPTPSNDSNLRAGSDIPVYGIKVKALYSDITVNRVDLQFEVRLTGSSGSEYKPSTLIEAVSLYEGDTEVYRKSISSSDIIKDSSNDYFVRLTDVSFKVEEGTTKTLTVKIDANTTFDTNRWFSVWAIGPEGSTNAIRGTDGLGLNTYAGIGTPRTFTIKKAGTAILTGTANNDTPLSNNVEYHSTDGVENVTLLVFDLKSTVGDSQLTQVKVNTYTYEYDGQSTGTYIKTADIEGFELYDEDGSKISSATIVAGTASVQGTATFENLEIDIAKDATKTFTVKGDFGALTTAANNKVKITVPTTSAYNLYETTDGASSNVTVSSAISSKVQYLYNEGVYITKDSSSIKITPSIASGEKNYATGTIKFTVEAFGGTLTKFTTAKTISVADGIRILAYKADGTAYGTGFSGVVTVSPDEDVTAGDTATVTATATVEGDTSESIGLVRFEIKEVYWTVGSTTGEQTWGLTDLVTPYEVLPEY